LLAHLGAALPLGGALEVMIAASVVLLGALLVSGAALPLGWVWGWWRLRRCCMARHTGWKWLQALPSGLGAGFVLSTAALHGGMGLGVLLQRVRAVLPRAAGALIGGAGWHCCWHAFEPPGGARSPRRRV
jgi:hydrogenase/urease accessory protein HupE